MLIDYLEHHLDTGQQQAVSTHLERCDKCRQELATLTRIKAVLENPTLKTPAPNLINQAIAAFRRRQKRPMALPRQQTELVFDSRQKGPPAGVRGINESRQLLFEVADFEVDLQISSGTQSELYTIQGQILPTEVADIDLAGFELQFSHHNNVVRRVLTDNLGRFMVSDIEAATYSLQIFFDQYDAIIEAIELQ